MRIVDTSAWIEWLIDSPTGTLIRPRVPQQHQILVPTVIQFELAKWLGREKPIMTRDVMNFTRDCVVVSLDTELAVDAADIARAHRLSIADAIIYATALAHGADLLTCDAHFEGLPHVLYVPKALS